MEIIRELVHEQGGNNVNYLNGFYSLLSQGLTTGDLSDIYTWQERYTGVEIIIHDFPAEGQASLVKPEDLYGQFGSCTSRLFFKDPNHGLEGLPKQFTLSPKTIGQLSLALYY